MAGNAQRSASAETEQEVLASFSENSRILTAVGLGATAVLALAAQRFGLTNELQQPFEAGSESLAHPVLGYMGAWAADTLSKQESKGVRAGAALLGATFVNFAAETAQSAVVASPEYINYLAASNQLETGKDLGAALLGMGLYIWQNNSGE